MEYQKRTEKASREALGGGGGETPIEAAPTSTTTTPAKNKEKKKEKKEGSSSSSSNGGVKSEADLLFNLHNKARTVFVTGTIDDRLSHRVVAQLVHLNNENAKLPIVMVINSGGGCRDERIRDIRYHESAGCAGSNVRGWARGVDGGDTASGWGKRKKILCPKRSDYDSPAASFDERNDE